MADDITETQATTPDQSPSQQADVTPTETQSDTALVDDALGTQEPIAPKDESATTPGEGSGDLSPAPASEAEAPAADADPLTQTAGTDGATPSPAADATEPTEQDGASDASAGAESAPSGGDGSQGTQLPEANAPGPVDPTAPDATGAGVAAPRGDAFTPGTVGAGPLVETSPDASTPESSMSTSDTTPTGASDPAQSTTETSSTSGSEPSTSAPDTSGDTASSTKPQPLTPAIGAAPAGSEPVPVVLTSPMLSDNSIPQPGHNDAPAQPFEGNTMFGGQAHPSPAPDVDPATILPHPALSEQSPGFISGTTQGTQGALPVPGPADQAQSAASTLSGTSNDAASGDKGSDLTKSTDSDATDATDATSALPIASEVQETFKTLSDDGKAIVEALGKVSDGIGDVIALEFKSLANVAAHISGRLDAVKHELDEPEQRAQLVTVANQVLELLGSLSGLFGEDQSEAPLPPDVETVLGNLGDLGAQARDALYAD